MIDQRRMNFHSLKREPDDQRAAITYRIVKFFCRFAFRTTMSFYIAICCIFFCITPANFHSPNFLNCNYRTSKALSARSPTRLLSQALTALLYHLPSRDANALCFAINKLFEIKCHSLKIVHKGVRRGCSRSSFSSLQHRVTSNDFRQL